VNEVDLAIDAPRGLAGILGALVGDALGVPFEFKRGDQIPRQIDVFMPPGFPKTYGHIPYGVWSDDGAQLLCLLDALLQPGGYRDATFAANLLRWRHDAWHQSGGVVFDCGLGTDAALRRLAAGVPPCSAGSLDERSNGNGSLMRVLPVAIVGHCKAWDVEAMVTLAERQSALTHGHPLAKVCCGLYVLIARRLLDTTPLAAGETAGALVADALDDAIVALGRLYAGVQHGQDALARIGKHMLLDLPTGSGYVVNSLHSALTAISQATGYREAVTRAIGFGNDTDTTACIAGGLAGIIWNGHENGIPRAWTSALMVPEESAGLLALYRQSVR
jgi:ADP-ribosylglycohydrolase